MKLEFIPLDKLSVSKANMRHARKAPDVSDILPTIRARGVLTPIIVRANPIASGNETGVHGDEDDSGFEIIAGRRRFHAAKIVADERRATGDEVEAMPCAILDQGDNADAIEASLIENLARLDPEEVTQWECFTRLIREGRSIDDLSATFGLPSLTVRRILALGNLLPRIRRLYASEAIDRNTVHHLTLASKRQQQAWLALADDPDAYLPTGQQLKAWLFGGATIPTDHALFDVDAGGLAIIADLFGERAYFADADAFWVAQNAAVEERRAAFLDEGWSDVVIVPPSEHFATWEFTRAAKRKGGRVYFDIRSNGEVVVHEGYLTAKEARRAVTKGDGAAAHRKPARPEITSTMQTYLDLHRHAAVRAALTAHPGVALRLMVAHTIAGSPLWSIRPEPQTTRNEHIAESIETCPAEAAFDERRRAVLAVLGFSPEEPMVTGGSIDGVASDSLTAIFHRLLDLPDPVIGEIIAVVIGETLASGSPVVEAVGLRIDIDMAGYWQADDAFFDLIRDREVLGRIVADVAGETVAAANTGEKTKVLKAIVRDALAGENGRNERKDWVPRWMMFPPSGYTARGGIGTVEAHARAFAAPPEIEREPDVSQDSNAVPADEPSDTNVKLAA